MKKILGILLLATILASCSVSQNGLTRHDYVRSMRAVTYKANGNSDAPTEMGRIEYNQRTRKQILRLAEEADTVKLFRGLLINSKTGLNEKATFVISSRFVTDVPYSFVLDPQSQIQVYLPAGEYVMQIYCGWYYQAQVFHVDPRRVHVISGQRVYFAAEKFMNDY